MKTLLSLVLLFALSASPSFAKSKSPQKQPQVTQNALQGKLTKYLNDHIKSITVVKDVVVFKTDGSVYQGGGSKTVVLKKPGDKFTCDYGKKSTTVTFWLDKVKKKNVQLSYRAVGSKDGWVSRDEGQIVLSTK